jgi:hypothetical protein
MDSGDEREDMRCVALRHNAMVWYGLSSVEGGNLMIRRPALFRFRGSGFQETHHHHHGWARTVGSLEAPTDTHSLIIGAAIGRAFL